MAELEKLELDVTMTAKGDTVLRRIGSFFYFHFLAWKILLLGTQEISATVLWEDKRG